ncbi:hypothetical protein SASPL_107262 [Salvia splendens]|uniref:ATP-dependent Clp protease proteolytic subunit n=1 Tax=Salvia splendens TaxID=180675 RepID=A0A8X8YEL2_SALSN|nr:hypothetical protein SASPL_107262 [Salvia splendens]
MAHSCVSSSSLRFNSSFSLSSPNPFSSSAKIVSFPFQPLRSRKLKSSNPRSSSAKAMHSPEFYAPERTSRDGIWSIRDDLHIPSSPYFPAYAQGGQGPPPMVQERFMSVISQLFQYRIIRCGGAVDDDMANIIVAQLLYLDAVDPTKDIVMYVNSPGGSVTAGMAIFDTMRHIRPDVSTVCVGLAASMGAFLLSGGTKGKRYSLPNSRIMIHQPLGGAQGGQTDIDIQGFFIKNPTPPPHVLLLPELTPPLLLPELTPPLLDEATGATQGLGGRNLPRAAAMKRKSGSKHDAAAASKRTKQPRTAAIPVEDEVSSEEDDEMGDESGSDYEDDEEGGGGSAAGAFQVDDAANEMLHHKANLNGYLAYHTGQSLEKINQDTDRDFFMSAKEAKEYGLIDGVILNPLKVLQPLAAVAE